MAGRTLNLEGECITLRVIRNYNKYSSLSRLSDICGFDGRWSKCSPGTTSNEVTLKMVKYLRWVYWMHVYLRYTDARYDCT